MSILLVPVGYAILLLVPGFGLWRLVRRGRPVDAGLDLAASIATGFAVHGVLLLAAFGLHLPLWSVAVGALVIGVAAFAVTGVPPTGWRLREHAPFVAIGLAAGLAGWRLWTLGGDAPYHVGRVRRLLTLDRLHLAQMPELVDGSNHPGYYVPLPHALVAESAWITGASPTEAYRASLVTLGLFAALVAGALSGRCCTTGAWPSPAAGSPPRPASPACASGRSWPTRRASPRSCCGRCSCSSRSPTGASSPAPRSRRCGAVAVLALTHVTYLPFALIALGGAAVAGAIRARGSR